MTTPLSHTKILEAGVLFELIVRLLGVDSTTKKAFLESCKNAHEESFTKRYANGSWIVQLQSMAHGGIAFHHCQGVLDEYYFAAELDRLRLGSHDYGSAEFKALDAIDRRCQEVIYGFRNGSEVHDPSSDRIERLRRVNTWIHFIATRGRKFFSDDGAMRTGRIAQFEFTDGKLWYRNQYDQLIWANAQKDLFFRKFAGGWNTCHTCMAFTRLYFPWNACSNQSDLVAVLVFRRRSMGLWSDGHGLGSS